jgi:(p)ppGpp synthase/HD superfamily hydrolase
MFNPERFAKVKHKGQKYGDKDYYEYHIRGVVDMVDAACNICENMRYDKTNIIAVAYLHDILEDTDTSYEQIDGLFGTIVADGVLAITKRKGQSYDQYLVQVNENQYARVVKRFDMIFNLSNSIQSRDDLIRGTDSHNSASRRVQKYLKGLQSIRGDF